MTRERSVLPALGFLLLTVPLMFAQDQQGQAKPALPADVVGPQLIVWSQAQKPKPVPQPLPPPDRAAQQPDPQTRQPADQAQAKQQDDQKPTPQTFTGTIVKDGASYVLKASDSTYQLDNQELVKQYEGKPVKIVGTLDPDGHSLRIVKVELMS